MSDAKSLLLPAPPSPANASRHFSGFQPAERPDEDRDENALIVRLFEVLIALDGHEARFLHGCLPRADSTFGVGLAFFLAAMAGGARGWLGIRAARSIDALDDGLLIDDVDDALKPRRRSTPDGRSWWVSRLPVLFGDDLKRMICAVAIPQEGDEGPLFVLQTRLPILGAVQLTGRYTVGQLDLALHTTVPLETDLAVDLCATANATLADLGMTGELTFAPLIGGWLDLDSRLHADTRL